MRPAIELALDEIRASVEADGGEIELVSVEDGVVHVRLMGGCHGCPGQAMTVAMTIEPMLKERVPGVKSVVAI